MFTIIIAYDSRAPDHTLRNFANMTCTIHVSFLFCVLEQNIARNFLFILKGLLEPKKKKLSKFFPGTFGGLSHFFTNKGELLFVYSLLIYLFFLVEKTPPQTITDCFFFLPFVDPAGSFDQI